VSLRFPGSADRVTTGNSVRVAAFGIGIERGGHCKIKIERRSRIELAGSVSGGDGLRCLRTPLPLRHDDCCTNGGQLGDSPARLARRGFEERCGPRSKDPPALQAPRRSNTSSPRGEPVDSPAHVPTPVLERRARDSEHFHWVFPQTRQGLRSRFVAFRLSAVSRRFAGLE
jgi:hypothetical protein